MAANISSLNARRALETLGSNIKTARLKRRISLKGFAERIGVSERTVIRLEKGDGGVSIGTLAMACLVLGEIDRISDLLDSGSDDIGLLLDKELLPKRIVGKRKKKSANPTSTKPARPHIDDEGVGF
ncbi:helix-turn-helix domain-containing protein [Granulosicoccus sp.]|nr:helix-turn-helix domain-containing protein [Granulosicoccus sp.]